MSPNLLRCLISLSIGGINDILPIPLDGVIVKGLSDRQMHVYKPRVEILGTQQVSRGLHHSRVWESTLWAMPGTPLLATDRTTLIIGALAKLGGRGKHADHLYAGHRTKLLK